MSGKGLDVGTHMLVAASKLADGSIQYCEQIDAFFTLDASEESKQLLEMLNIPHIEKKKSISVIGEPARKFANMFNAETRRPLQQGCLNKKDMDSLGMLHVLIADILGSPSQENELLKYSVTSTPIGTDMDFTYHKSQLESIFTQLGYKPEPIQEARAIALSELAADKFSGLTISFGAGTTTVYLGHYGVDNPRLQFSVDKGGDWIDSHASEMFAGLTQTKVQTVKEKGFNILNPNGGVDVEELEGAKLLEARARDALSAYYKAFIKNVFKLVEHKFNNEQVPEFEDPIKCVIAGGTSLAGDFIDVCKQEIKALSLPFEISDVIHAKDPTHAVAKGCLIAAELEERKKARK
jgi:hypothetical protein